MSSQLRKKSGLIHLYRLFIGRQFSFFFVQSSIFRFETRRQILVKFLIRRYRHVMRFTHRPHGRCAALPIAIRRRKNALIRGRTFVTIRRAHQRIIGARIQIRPALRASIQGSSTASASRTTVILSLSVAIAAGIICRATVLIERANVRLISRRCDISIRSSRANRSTDAAAGTADVDST